ncbi:hypothetical protein D3C78_1905300 [compost metagenome]
MATCELGCGKAGLAIRARKRWRYSSSPLSGMPFKVGAISSRIMASTKPRKAGVCTDALMVRCPSKVPR